MVSGLEVRRPSDKKGSGVIFILRPPARAPAAAPAPAPGLLSPAVSVLWTFLNKHSTASDYANKAAQHTPPTYHLLEGLGFGGLGFAV